MTKAVKRKFYRNFFILIAMLSVVLSSTMCVGAAIDYNKLPYGIVRRIEKVSVFKSAIRSAEYTIIVNIGKLVDMVKSAVDEVISSNLYTYVRNNIKIKIGGKTIRFDNWTADLAFTLLTLSLIFGAIYLITHPDKFRISEFMRSTIIAVFLILTLPMLMSELDNLLTAGQNDIANVNQTSKDQTLGEQIVGQNITVIGIDYTSSSWTKLADDEKVIKYNVLHKKNKTTTPSVYSLDINGYADKKVFDKYVTSAEPKPPVSDDDIDVRRMFELLGYKKEYERLFEFKGDETIFVEDRTLKSQGVNSPSPMQRNYNNAQYIAYLARLVYYDSHVSPEEKQQIGFLMLEYFSSADQSKVANILRRSILGSKAEDVKVDKSDLPKILENILDIIKTNTLVPLNNKANQSGTLDNSVGQYSTEKLKSDSDYEDMGLEEKLMSVGDVLLYGKNEHIYNYAIDFIPCLITLVVLLICLIFSGLKLAALLYDILFMQIIAPIVIATDLQGAGRTKKIIQEMLNVYLVFIIVMLDFKIYFVALNWIFTSSSFSIIAQLFVILGGMKFCIDGPDIVTKLLGIDAGVKSGYGTLMGVQAAARMATGAVRSTSNFAKGVASTPAKVGGKAGEFAGRMDGYRQTKEADGKSASSLGAFIGGGVLHMGGQSSAVQSFRNSRNQANRTNSDYLGQRSSSRASSTVGSASDSGSTADTPISSGGGADVSGGSDVGADGGSSSGTADAPEISSSTPVIIQGEKGDKGDKGDRGITGERGTKGDKGADGQDGKEGANGNSGANGSTSVVSSERTSGSSSRAGGAFRNLSHSNANNGSSAPTSSTASSKSAAPRPTMLNDKPVSEAPNNSMKQEEAAAESKAPIREMLENNRGNNVKDD